MIYSSSSYGNLGKILGQLCVESALNFSTPTSHSSASDLNFTLKSCIFNIVLYNLEPHSDCMWAPGLLAQSTAAGREDHRGSFQRDYFVLGGFLRLRGDLWNGFGKLASPFRILDDHHSHLATRLVQSSSIWYGEAKALCTTSNLISVHPPARCYLHSL